MMSLQRLSQMLDEHYRIPPIIIDEYDTPIQQGYVRSFYDDVILFMRNLFFGGLNNLAVNSILDN